MSTHCPEQTVLEHGIPEELVVDVEEVEEELVVDVDELVLDEPVVPVPPPLPPDPVPQPTHGS